ncbi:Alpha/beta knot methyltransferase [Tricharina praecox]|uniref:Alpha/beta knot methyltransferase n=1 Tax=Tricharina praecox TaxID=43433 RepID=UPI00221F8E50|nr:Alpha/beta knot methyltransferase [Tricharina praecox]KAI5851867.1 Alpha/beta knot methyltransferase [Tricharina praecox]
MNLLRFAAHGAPKSLLLKNSYRCASYNSAIHRGVDREARAESTFDRGSRDSSSRPPYTPREGSSRPPYTPREGSSRPPYTPREGSSRPPYTPREGERPTARRDDRYAAPARDYVSTPRRTIQKVNQDSEWIYGTSVVEAALKSNRRQLFRLYIHSGENRTATSRERDIKLKNLARGLKIDVREVEDSSILDSMSNSRPHNGYVLEASKLLKTPIISLSNVSFDRTAFGLQISQHDFTESGIILNELPQTIPNRDPTRYPLVLMLDEILDPGNLGAILRSAYFMGCSALMVAERNCAPLSPTCLKSSAGASEYMPILTQINPARLIEASKEAGWKFFGAAPRPKYASSRYIGMDHNVVKEALKTSPVVLLMGGEAEGIRESIKKLCDKCVSITAAEDVDRGIDSLNVSVAAGVLMQAFLGGRKAIPVLEAGMEDVVEDVKAESGIAAAEEDVTAEEDVATEEDVVADEAAVDETVELESTEELTETSDEPAKSHM